MFSSTHLVHFYWFLFKILFLIKKLSTYKNVYNKYDQLKNNKMNFCIAVVQVKTWNRICALEATGWALNVRSPITSQDGAGGPASLKARLGQKCMTLERKKHILIDR